MRASATPIGKGRRITTRTPRPREAGLLWGGGLQQGLSARTDAPAQPGVLVRVFAIVDIDGDTARDVAPDDLSAGGGRVQL